MTQSDAFAQIRRGADELIVEDDLRRKLARGKPLRVKDDLAGKYIKCPACAHKMFVPGQGVTAQPVRPSPPPLVAPAIDEDEAEDPVNEDAVTAHCSLRDADVTLSFSPSEVAERFRRELAKRLGKKEVELAWRREPRGAEVRIRFVRIDEGNQFLRWLVPFIAPAVVEIEGEVALRGHEPRPFEYVRKAHFGFFGGTPQYMVGVCADRLARGLAKEILRALD